jgi:hypothetical protein
MLDALLAGKLSREQENMEDILTSNVFGVFKYLPPEMGLLPFLSKMKPEENNPFAGQSERGLNEVDYQFWRWLKEVKGKGCEPDVLIRFASRSERKKYIVLVEAKYRSGKSSLDQEEEEEEEEDGSESEQQEVPALNDQLAREWDNLLPVAEREGRTPLLVYVTAHLGFPSEEIRVTQESLKRWGRRAARIFWVSWRHLPALGGNNDNKMLRDLAEALRRMNLVFFEGISVNSVMPIDWSFSFDEKRFEWSFLSPTIDWSFSYRGQIRIDWKGFDSPQTNWRFLQ